MKSFKLLILTLILALAFVLRLTDIEWGLPGADHHWSYHPDESKLFLGLKAFPPSFHPYDSSSGTGFFGTYGMWTMIGWMLRLYPIRGGEEAFRAEPEALYRLYLWNRLLTVLFSTATVLLVYLLSRSIGMFELEALGATFLQALLPFAVLHSKYITPHSASVAFTLLTLVMYTHRAHPVLISLLALMSAASEYSLMPLWIILLVFEFADRRRFKYYLITGIFGILLFYNILVDPVGWFNALYNQRKFIQPLSTLNKYVN